VEQLKVSVDFEFLVGHGFEATEVPRLASKLSAEPRARAAAMALRVVVQQLGWKRLGDRIVETAAPVSGPWRPVRDEYGGAEITRFWREIREGAQIGAMMLPTLSWAGFHLSVGEKCIIGHHFLRFSAFSKDLEGLRRPLMECSRAVAECVGSAQVVYGPDSASRFELVWDLVADGADVGSVLLKLEECCGEPCASFDELEMRRVEWPRTGAEPYLVERLG